MTHPTQALLERLETTAATLANHGYSTDAVMDAISEIRRLEAENERLRGRCKSYAAALTPSAETKATYIGEIKERICQLDEDGDEVWVDHTISWDATKQIMAMIIGHAGMIEVGTPLPDTAAIRGETGE